MQRHVRKHQPTQKQQPTQKHPNQQYPNQQQPHLLAIHTAAHHVAADPATQRRAGMWTDSRSSGSPRRLQPTKWRPTHQQSTQPPT
eukprot:86118-Chlamydomonas_euryale.AAC.2